MKKKTINAIISKKMNQWLDTIQDENLRKLAKKDLVVTGGCITSMLLNEEIHDFDVYFKTKDTLKAVAQYYTEEFNGNNPTRLAEVLVEDERVKMFVKSAGIAEDSDTVADDNEYNVNKYVEAVSVGDELPAKVIEESKYKPIFISTNAITLSNKIQIVVRFYGTPEEIHQNYDFVHTTQYWTYNTGVVLNQAALESILNKELQYVGSKYPLCSLVRTRKFIKRGWNINAGQYVKMAFQISELDLTDPNVLEDQLVGVDSVYFLNFIEGLKRKIDENKNFALNQQYLTTVIDRIFG